MASIRGLDTALQFLKDLFWNLSLEEQRSNSPIPVGVGKADIYIPDIFHL